MSSAVRRVNVTSGLFSNNGGSTHDSSSNILVPTGGSLGPVNDVGGLVNSAASPISSATLASSPAGALMNNPAMLNSTKGSNSTPIIKEAVSSPSPAMIELQANTTTAVNLLIGLQIGSIALALLLASPLIFKHVKTGRYKKGWFLTRKKENSANHATRIIVAQSVNRASDVPIGQKSSTLKVELSRIHNILFLKTLPWTQITVGRFFILTFLFLFTFFGLMYKNTQDPFGNLKRPGWVAAALLPLQFLLSMKNSPLGLVGKSYAQINYIHRFLGRLISFSALLHGSIWWKRKIMAKKPITLNKVTLAGLIGLISFMIIGLSSVKWFRSKMYQTFLVCHILGMLSALVALWNHVPPLKPIVALSGSMILLDYFLSYLKTSVRSAVFTSLPGGVTRIEIDRIGEGWKAGQYVYLRVFNGSRSFEKHPFTIANSPAELSPSGRSSLLLIVKASGDFTSNIHRVGYAEAALVGGDLESHKSPIDEKGSPELFEAASDRRLAVAVEGPYGVSYSDMCDNETVMLIAGGSGFTYCMSIFEHIVGNALKGVGFTKKVFLIWTLRDLEMVHVFSAALNTALEYAQKLRLEVLVRLYITTPLKHGDINPVPLAQITPSRVDIKGVVSEALESTCFGIDTRGETQGCGVAVGVCGPEGLLVSARDAVRAADYSLARKAGGLQLHLEAFQF